MDKKNTTIGVLLILAAFGFMIYGQRFAPRPAAPATPATSSTATATPSAPNAPSISAPATPVDASGVAVAAVDSHEAAITTLENDYISVSFTNFGGAVRDAALKKHPADQSRPDPYLFNGLHADPMLAFVDLPGLDRNTAYQLVSKSATEVVYRATYDNRIEVTRRYTIAPDKSDKTDPYQLRHETTLRNLTNQPIPLPRFGLSLGTAAPINAKDVGVLLTSGYSDGKDQTFIPRSKLEASGGVFGFGAHEAAQAVTSGGPVAWASVGNQFFTTIFTPDNPAAGMVTRRVKLFSTLADTDRNAYGLTAAIQFDLASLAPNAETKLGAGFYVGPKEYRRLSNSDVFKQDQDKIMQFGMFKWFSQLLLTLMSWIHGWFPGANWAWGWAIVLTTLFLKIVFVPFTLAASRSAKRMQKIQPEMQAIREKFKDNPQKLQAATMELFKKHKVNPVGGCLPVLITLPFFFGFFQMLRSTAELRFAPFLWATDLSASDTVGHVLGLPINIMPVLLGATMIVQMHLTPSPTTDNAQAKMMKFMPYMFALFCYNLPCSLALYSTINGLFTIGQQLVINRTKDDDPANVPAAVTSSGKPIKNVTPKKR